MRQRFAGVDKMDPEKKQIPCYLTCVEGEHWSRLLQCCPPMSSNTVLAPVVSVFFAASVPVHVQLVSGHARASPLTGLVLAALSSSPWSCATSSCIGDELVARNKLSTISEK
ncbi:hypothetical protein KC19_6G089400 [Ceratodon purpureus]|uniref:Uncharacterized protein n=1 Tax=Ceratodon purpureus TaxID=3225 RepID=A0A8T0HCC0_CERPU|nr:hypothetical protein KC19_6G089400 [Ceratodon purpureus]